MRLSGVMDADEGVAVTAFVGHAEIEGQGRPPVALGDDERVVRQHGGQRLRQLAPEARRQAVWRGGKGEIVMTSLPGCRPEESHGVRAAYLAHAAEGLEVGTDGLDRGLRGVDEGRLRRPARERLEAESA